MARMLRKKGDDVDAVFDGIEAIEHLQNNDYDLVLTDLKMEPIDGLQVLKAAREQRPPVEVIVFTAYGAVDVAVEAMRLGARDFLTKPVSIDQISERLAQIRPYSPDDDATEESHAPANFVADDPASQQLLDTLKQVAPVPSPVWIEGELGSGRGFAAEALHRFSGTDGPFTVFDVARHAEWPQSGTVVLPNIDDLPDDLQRELYRSLQRRPDGVRVVTTAGLDGRRLVAEGRLRAELYYALAVVVVQVPPLRERPADIVPLVRAGLRYYADRYKRPVPKLSTEQEGALRRHSWPGNVRELLNLSERAVVMGTRAFDLQIVDAAAPGLPKLEPGFSLSAYLESVERRILVEALRRSGGDRSQAGKLLGVERNSLRYKLNKYGLLEK